MPLLNLTHPVTDGDWRRLQDFARQADPERDRAAFLYLLRERPGVDPERHAMLVEEGAVVATASLLPHHHYMGDGELEVGEIGLLCVHPERRLEGHARRLVGHWLDAAREAGYPYVYMYGEPRFCERLGFMQAAPGHGLPTVRMDRDALAPILSPHRVRPLIAADLPVLEELYDQANCRTPLAEVRTPEHWAHRLGHTRQGGFGWWVAADAENQPRGYVWADLPHARLREVVAGDEEAARAILQWMRWELTERKLPEFTAQVPLNQLFARVASRLGAWTASPLTQGGPMLKVLRLQPILESLRPHLEERIRDSRYAPNELQVTLVMGEEAVSLRWSHGQRLQVAPGAVGREIALPPALWGPLLTGFRAIDDMPVELGEAERHLLRTLFANGHPFVWDLEYSEAM